jgi:hypothetical protein
MTISMVSLSDDLPTGRSNTMHAGYCKLLSSVGLSIGRKACATLM